jgi:predicted dehydrogenase
MVSVGLIGLGAIGRLHFGCWAKSPHARVAAIASRDPRKRQGDWPASEFNLGAQSNERVDLSGITAYADAHELLADPRITIVDICSSTPHHASLAIAALRAGKHVVCEKPMALSVAECVAMEEAARLAERELMVAHCLRYWPHYMNAHVLLGSGAFGKPLYAQLYRTGALPAWSAEGWLMEPMQSGGVLDMHIHDIDVALWWFGEPTRIESSVATRTGLPIVMDATWHYSSGPLVQLHSSWDPNGGAFCHGFRLIMEKGTLTYDLGSAPNALQLTRDGAMTELPVDPPTAHQAELDDFARCIAAGEPFSRFTPADSRRAVEIGLEELRAVTTE